MELYTAGTGNWQRAAIAVNECGLPCTMHVLNLRKATRASGSENRNKGDAHHLQRAPDNPRNARRVFGET